MESSESGNTLNGNETNRTTLQTTTAASPPLHSQMGYSSPTTDTNHWLHNTLHQQHRGEQEEQMDGFQATTLVGVGGLIGWTAAAAYRWLNGGDFSMFPPPPATSYNNHNNRNMAQQAAATHLHENVSSPAHWNSHKEQALPPPTTTTTTQSQRPPQETPQTDKLAEQVQTLVEALQKQSAEHCEIVKRLSQQLEKQQTNESMQRLRAENASSSTQDQSSSSAASMAIFCKLAEIQAELSNLRRDVRTGLPTESLEKWDERLSCTLDQVQSCVTKLQTDSQSSSRAIVDTTPVRPKMNWVDETVNDQETNKTATTGGSTTNETDTHAVASALRQLVLENNATPLRVGAQLLYLYAVNLVTHPAIPRYRKIFTANESFQRVDTLKGGRELLRAVGFKDGDKALEWEPGQDKEEHYLSLMNEVSTAVGILKSPGQASSGELLEKVLSCLSSLSAVTTTPTPTKSDNEPDIDTAGSTLPAVYKTPDPSILSPPATKKQGMHSNPTVGFSPSILNDSSAANESFFADDKNSSEETPMDSLVDADDVWK